MLLRSLHITDTKSAHNGQIRDLRVDENQIAAIAEHLDPEDGEAVIDLTGVHATSGFVDIGAYLGDPGHEEREDITSMRAAAAAGGYTTVAVLPDTDPVRQSVADVAYLLRQNGKDPVDLYPLVALSKNLEGKDMVEMLDLNDAGALVFTDGPERNTSASLLKRTLEYSRVRDLTVMVSPFDPTLAPDGQIHEGETSTRMGLRGIPEMSEVIPLKTALEIQAYTAGILIVHLISTAAGVAEVRRAKEAGLEIFATVSAHHLQFTVEELAGFDPDFKMLPPLRGEADRRALIEGLKDGTIDAIVSNHHARHGEEKDLEFSYADFGALGLQTAFRQAMAALRDEMPLDELVDKFNRRPGLLLGRMPTRITVGGPAALTLFSPEGESTFAAEDIRGKTKNSPLVGRVLPGKIVGVVNHGVFLKA